MRFQWGDASRLLSFYQEWLDDLFPKAKFLDALAMVEKAGHNKMMQKMRVEWINEGKPKDKIAMTTIQDEEEDQQQQSKELGETRQSGRVTPIFEKAPVNGDRLRTPETDDLFGDDIYNATPIGAGSSGGLTDKIDEPDEDELDALMAETEGEGSGRSAPTKPKTSIFGDDKPRAAERPRRTEPEEDDLDALLAEAEAQEFSVGDAEPLKTKTSDAVGGDEDDLDMAITNGETQARSATGRISGADSSDSKQPAASEFDDEEEAMAEMDGLW